MIVSSKIEFMGDNGVVVWKHPMVNFNNNTKLIVRDSQEAIFFLNGEALDSFSSGEHILETGKMPLLSQRLFGKLLGADYFSSEVYFVNKVELMDNPWGTNDYVIFRDKTLKNYPFEVKARGRYSVQIVEPRKIVKNLVGTELALGKERFAAYFYPMIMQNVSVILTKAFAELECSIYEINGYKGEIAEKILKELNIGAAKYGFEFISFYIETLSLPIENETFIKHKELMGKDATMDMEQMLEEKTAKHLAEIGRINARGGADASVIAAEGDARATEIRAQGVAHANEALHITEREKMGIDVAKAVASNPNSGGMINSGIGMGAMLGVASGTSQQMATFVNNAIAPVVGGESESNVSQLDGDFIPPYTNNDEFVPPFGKDNTRDDFKTRVDNLKYLKDNKMISEAEYSEAIAELKKEIMS